MHLLPLLCGVFFLNVAYASDSSPKKSEEDLRQERASSIPHRNELLDSPELNTIKDSMDDLSEKFAQEMTLPMQELHRRTTGSLQSKKSALSSGEEGKQQQPVTELAEVKRTKLEGPRRLFHSIGAFILPSLWALGVSTEQASYLVAPLTLFYGVAELLRFRNPSFNAQFCNSFPLKYILRNEEIQRHKITSSMYYLVAVHLTAHLFEPHVAYLAAMYLFLCDPAAGLFGRRWGHRLGGIKLMGNKTLVGSMGAAAVGFMITSSFLLLTAPEVDTTMLLIHSVLGGLFASMAELFSLRGIDDNLTLPLMAGILLTWISDVPALYAAHH